MSHYSGRSLRHLQSHSFETVKLISYNSLECFNIIFEILFRDNIGEMRKKAASTLRLSDIRCMINWKTGFYLKVLKFKGSKMHHKTLFIERVKTYFF